VNDVSELRNNTTNTNTTSPENQKNESKTSISKKVAHSQNTSQQKESRQTNDSRNQKSPDTQQDTKINSQTRTLVPPEFDGRILKETFSLKELGHKLSRSSVSMSDNLLSSSSSISESIVSEERTYINRRMLRLISKVSHIEEKTVRLLHN
jgi:cobalamin-dependent methionine synthase I